MNNSPTPREVDLALEKFVKETPDGNQESFRAEVESWTMDRWMKFMNIKTDSICPTCGIEVANKKCRLCGARMTINSVSGNAIWMRNGRVVKGFSDEKQAYIQMARQWGIPENRWPDEFKK